MELDLSILPSVPERKGSLYLRSNHMKYTCGTLNYNWHVDQEAEPKDYDINAAANSSNVKKDLQRSTYQHIGNTLDKWPLETTTLNASKEPFDLREDYKPRIIQMDMIDAHNFDQGTKVRDTDTLLQGYSSVLPHHTAEHSLRYLESTHRRDYVYPYMWKPGNADGSHDGDVHFHRKHSQFTDTADYRHRGCNAGKWQDHR